jgi:DNA-binding NarL/FixJ family response regulator
MAGQKEPVHHFEVSFRTASGAMTDTGVTVLVIPNGGSSDFAVVHLLQPARATAAMQPEVVLSDGLAKLTPRELEVLRLIADGRNTAEVAAELFIGAATVRHHSRGILRKLGVHSRLEAAAVYHQAVSG